ncbi:hypothetical protein [Pseudidiomarina mangrovi]|uniref:hypothetical protein n=1 Tax=Pseudidiomarina mangrovi TaxID=2487133 RepID=UPI000FCA7584|nr:hypothetical protein [Pseudidiomarina mangrovi]CAI8152273.1 MAG: Uncharacterised protein [Pseudidiomarina mangrovi]
MAKSTDRERDRVFQVSSNRGSAQHKLRYVESSVGSEDLQDCRMCRTAIPAQSPTNARDDAKLLTREDDQANS